MSNDMNGGVSKRSLVLLGGLAALALNRDVRRGLVQGSRNAVDNAQSTLDETVKPALSTAAQQAQHAARLAAHQAGDTWETLREEAPQRAQGLVGTAQHVVEALAATAAERAAQLKEEAERTAKQAQREYAPKVAALTHEARDAAEKAKRTYAPKVTDLSDHLLDSAEDRREALGKALKQARKKGLVALADLGERAGQSVDEAADAIHEQRRSAERALARARRDIEKDLRRNRRNWNAKKLEKAIEKRMAPVHKDVQRQLALAERQWGKKVRTIQANTRPERSGMGGGTTALMLLGTGLVVLARVPAARHKLITTVEGFSPEAATKLHEASRQARSLVGDLWMEGPEHTLAIQGPVSGDRAKSEESFQAKSSAEQNTSQADQNQNDKNPS